MNRDDFFAALCRPAQLQAQHRALQRLLEEAYAAGERMPDDAQRMRAHMARLLQLKDYILDITSDAVAWPPAPDGGRGAAAADGPGIRGLDEDSLASHRFELMAAGATLWMSLVKRVRYRYRHQVRRRVFRPELCGDPAFRDAGHEALAVLSADDESGPNRLGQRYAYAQVEPFMCRHLRKARRAALYTTRLEPRRLAAQDLQTPEETDLIGQWGVFAKTPIAAGTCLGVYGGQLLDAAGIFVLEDDRYLLSASEESGQTAVNGENMMSLMNTLFVTAGGNAAKRHPDTGYTVERATFKLRMACGWKVSIAAFFASIDIQPGTELRWNYELGAMLSSG